jgi:hypothetical protein
MDDGQTGNNPKVRVADNWEIGTASPSLALADFARQTALH